MGLKIDLASKIPTIGDSSKKKLPRGGANTAKCQLGNNVIKKEIRIRDPTTNRSLTFPGKN